MNRVRGGQAAAPAPITAPAPETLAMAPDASRAEVTSRRGGGDGLDETPASPASLVWPLRIIAAATLVALLYVGRPVLLPIVLSVFLFYALDPLVDRLESWHVPRALASVLAVVLVVGSLAAGAVALWPQFETVVTRVPEAARQLNRSLRAARSGNGGASAFTKMQEAVQAIDEAAAASSSAPSVPRGTLRVEVTDTWRLSDALWAGSMGLLGLVGQTVGVLFLTIFLLVEDDTFKRRLVRRMESIGSKRVTVQVLKDIAQQVEQFLWVQALTSAGVAVVTGIGLWWMGVENPAVWGVFAGLMNLVPFFGPLIVTVVVGAVAFLQFGTLRDASLVAAMTIVITTLEGNFITPHLLSRKSSLNLVAIFIAIAFWSWVWGVAGMILAVPILMAVKVVCDRVEGGEILGEFLGTSPDVAAAVPGPSPVKVVGAGG
jgi:predicted PurR-regulated permease PerM